MGTAKKKLRDIVAYLNENFTIDLQALTHGKFNNGPEVTDTMIQSFRLTQSKMNNCGMFLSYLWTFASDRYKIHITLGNKDETLIFAEEDFYGNYAVYNTSRNEIVIPEDPSEGIPLAALLAIYGHCVSSVTTRNDFISSGCDEEWRTADPKLWSSDMYSIRDGIEKVSSAILDWVEEEGDEVFYIRKQTMAEELLLPMSHEPKSKDSLFKVAESLREFELAQEKIADARKVEAEKEAAESLKKSVMTAKPTMVVEDDLKHLIPKEEEVSYLVNVPWHYAMARAIDNPILPSIASLLYGPSGPGKSAIVKWLAYKAQIPYWAPFKFGSNTQEDILFGSHRFVDGVPQFILSNIMKCAKYGGIVELQEVAICRDPAVLVALNNVFEPHGKIRIEETGEEFELNKNARFVLTTNMDYAGCKALNESVGSRPIYAYEVPELLQSEYVERTISQLPQVKMEESYINQMAACYINLIQLVKTSSCRGDTSYRTFKDWVAYTYLYGDPLEAAEYFLVHKMCMESNQKKKQEIRAMIQGMLQKKPQNVYTEPEEIPLPF